MHSHKLKGPYATDLRVYITDGEKEGQVTVSLSSSETPTQEMLDHALALATKSAEESGFRLMTKTEFFHAILREKTGLDRTFAIPGGDVWDV